MGCSSCSGGGGVPNGCRNNGSCGNGGCNKLTVFDWLANMKLPNDQVPFDCVEVRFKNGRKEFYRNINNLPLAVGDTVAVEASPGHDIGVVSVIGELVRVQMRKKKVKEDSEDVKKLYRKATQKDIDKWQEARNREHDTMHRSREIALKLGLKMKLSDVEFQGDGSKATFYYTADERVDFRQLIKDLAGAFSVRIEMRQIGARQEAARLGGIGSCGRELCCSTWLTDFRSVNTSAARYQQLSLNPQKLAGQCGKLKCCLNYELDSYMDALKVFPDTNVRLKTKQGEAFFQKMDVFSGRMWYSYTTNPQHFIQVTVDSVKEVIESNKRNELPHALEEYVEEAKHVVIEDYTNVVGQDSLTRFDQPKKKKKRRNNKSKNNNRNRNKNAKKPS